MIKILYEDDVLIVAVKPAGTATLAKLKGGVAALSEELAAIRPKLGDIHDNGIAHRLDNDTSGIVCVGMTQSSYENLRTQFASNKTDKVYIALVLGAAPNDETIDASIAHHPRKKKKMVVCESTARAEELKAREAHTVYHVLKRYMYRDTHYTLIEVEITSGVRHQIRAHLAWKGFPLAGDKLYQNRTKRTEDILPLDRHFLHACKLEIDHPESGARMTLKCPLPDDLEKALSVCHSEQGD